MATARPADEGVIRGKIATLVEAIRAMDLEALKPIYAADIVSFDVQPPLQHVGAEAKLRNWTEAFTVLRPPLGYEIADLRITVHGDVAFAHSLNRLSGTLSNGSGGGFWVRATVCFQKVEGDWLVVHDHVSVPLDIGTGRAWLDLEPVS